MNMLNLGFLVTQVTLLSSRVSGCTSNKHCSAYNPLIKAYRVLKAKWLDCFAAMVGLLFNLCWASLDTNTRVCFHPHIKCIPYNFNEMSNAHKLHLQQTTIGLASSGTA